MEATVIIDTPSRKHIVVTTDDGEYSLEIVVGPDERTGRDLCTITAEEPYGQIDFRVNVPS